MTLLEVNNLATEYKTEAGILQATEDISFTLEAKETLGLVGESGCGKSTVAKSLFKLLPENGRIAEGEVLYKGRDLTQMSEKELRAEIRWKEISWIAQNAMSALDPVHSIGSQFIEVIRTHTDQSKAEAKERAESLLEDVELDPAVMRDYPHELSGGQRQRAMIALSLVLDPSLIIADEPTTGLDVVVQDDILKLLADIQDETDCAIIFITHDIDVVTQISDKVGVMYAGQMVEKGDTHEVFTDSKHPYTIGLRNASPSLDQDMSDLITIPGQTENLLHPPTGCRFKSRCPFAEEKCEQDPPSEKLNNDHEAKCHFVNRADEFQQLGRELETWTQKQ